MRIMPTYSEHECYELKTAISIKLLKLVKKSNFTAGITFITNNASVSDLVVELGVVLSTFFFSEDEERQKESKESP